MRSIRMFSLAASLLAMVFIVSCKKDKQADEDTTAVTDNALAENESNKVIEAVNDAASDHHVNKPADGTEAMGDSTFSPCAVITIDTSSTIRTITIDFGSVPCQCVNWDNKWRQGKIMASWTGTYRDAGTVITITTDEYYAGWTSTTMNRHDYLKTVTNAGINSNGNIHFSVVVTNGTITLYTGQTITWQSTRDREWVEGESTPLPLDDAYLITGAASGIDRNGNPFTVTISNALKVEFCPWIVSGMLVITHGTLPAATIDYGNGECDNKATITVNGHTYDITL